MKKVFLFAAAAALFVACSSKDEVVKDDIQQPQLENGAIGFDVYTQKATTRAGWPGLLTTLELQKNGVGMANGFGVFGYYTDNNEYDQRSVPNFMYNQQVTWKADPGYWEYAPIMYWPNEYGSNAISDDQDKVSFFAYAPYVEVIPTSGKIVGADADKSLEQWGITGMTRNSNQGDPILKYIASFDKDKSVDLCWGVAPGSVWNTTQTGTDQNIKAGYPWLDVERPANTNQKVKFIFKHATAQMQINIDADVNVDGRGHDKDVDNKTRVWVRQITFKGFAMKGSLNLNNDDPSDAEKPKWLDYNGQNEIVAEDITVYDGRKDGKEGVNGAVATNEKSLGLNDEIIQDEPYAGYSWTGGDASTPGNTVYNAETLDGKHGVTKNAVPLFKNGGIFHVIPTDDAFEVEIVYDIETVDPNLAQNLSDNTTKGSSIENRISKQIKFGSDATSTFTTLKPGHSYKLDLHLGLNSVEFDATVSGWLEEAPQDVDLPLNIPAFVAKTTPASAAAYNVTLPYTGSYTFAMTGLDGGESITTDPSTNTAIEVSSGYTNWSVTKDNANNSGVAIQTLNAAVNPTTVNRVKAITWTGSQSGKGVKMTFTQKAHPLFMTITKMVNNSSNKGEITLTRWNNEAHESDIDWKKEDASYNTEGWLTGSAAELKVYRNGILLTSDVTFANDSPITDEASNKITIGDKLQNGDVIKVVLTTGDAPTETVTAVFEGLKFVNSTASVQYKSTGTYSVTDLNEIKNNLGTITYEIIGGTGIASLSGTNITTDGVGKVTVKATDSENSATATFELEVTKQETTLTVDPPATSPGTYEKGGIVCTFTPHIKGNIDNTDLANKDVQYKITGAYRNGNTAFNISSYFEIDGDKLKIKSDLYHDASDTFHISVKVTGTVTGEDASKYSNPSSEGITVNVDYTTTVGP